VKIVRRKSGLKTTELQVSVICPLHNEAEYLKYSLPSLTALAEHMAQVIIILDNNQDQTPEIIYTWAQDKENVWIEEMGPHKMKYYASECFNYGFNLCDTDIMMTWAGDLLFDPYIKQSIEFFFRRPNFGTLCFRYLNFNPLNLRLRLHGHYENLYRNLIERVRPETRHTGVYAIAKQCWDEVGPFPDIISEYDYFCHKVRASRWALGYEPRTRILHLRPGLTPKKQYSQGTARAYLPGYGLIKTLFHSLIHFKPYLLTGFLHARKYQIFDTGTLSHD
jgi:glycosyltransferase involved in cell wall biosynthesis